MPLESDPTLAQQPLGAPSAEPHPIPQPSPIKGLARNARLMVMGLLGLLSTAPGCSNRDVNDAIQNFVVQEGIDKRGAIVAEQAIREAPQKRGIRVKTADGVDLGLLSGPDARTNPTLCGIDGSIPVPPEAFEKINGKQGHLYWYYRAFIELEDNEFDPRYCKAPNCNPQSARTGINSQAWKRWMEGLGGSGAGDQTCGAMRAGFKEQKLPEARKFWLAKDWMKLGARIYSWESGKKLKDSENALVYKMEDLACGIGLANKKLTPPQIMAYNATYAYLAPGAEGVERFVRLYWGFSGINDPRMDTGHQMVLAALHNLPWNSTESRWREIKKRALIPAANILRKDDYKIVREQINASRPFSKEQQVKSSVNLAPEFEGPLLDAVDELVKIEGDKFRTTVKEIVLTVHFRLQEAAKTAANSMKGKAAPDAHPIFYMVGSDKKVWVDYTDDQFRFREDRERNMGSFGKTMIAAAEAKRENDIEKAKTEAASASTTGESALTGASTSVDPTIDLLKSFQAHLTWSQREIIDDAHALGVDPSFVRNLMDCYGTPPPAYLNKDGKDEVNFAALGNFGISPENAVKLMYAVSTGEALGEMSALESYTTWDGVVHTVQPRPPSAQEIQCAKNIWQGGKTKEKLAWPLDGTAQGLKGKVSIAKTGTTCVLDSRHEGQLCDERGANNAVFVVAAKGSVAFVAGLGADRPEQIAIKKGGTSIQVAVPMGVIMADALR